MYFINWKKVARNRQTTALEDITFPNVGNDNSGINFTVDLYHLFLAEYRVNTVRVLQSQVSFVATKTRVSYQHP
jgi:hypothetical protein